MTTTTTTLPLTTLAVVLFCGVVQCFNEADGSEREKRVFCRVTDWGGWSDCNNRCGLGSQYRTRQLIFGWCWRVQTRENRGCGQRNGGCQHICRHGYCSCHAGYRNSGQMCYQVNECQSNPCKNGGRCVDNISRFSCVCKTGFKGRNCEQLIDPCISTPCQNGGICTESGGRSFTCSCRPGYTGRICDRIIDNCNSQPCKYGSTCINKINAYNCICLKGLTGMNCQNNIDECLEHEGPCFGRGICIDEIGGFRCICINGFAGARCNYQINNGTCSTNNPCQNNAPCEDVKDGIICKCPAGIFGRFCQHNPDGL